MKTNLSVSEAQDVLNGKYTFPPNSQFTIEVPPVAEKPSVDLNAIVAMTRALLKTDANKIEVIKKIRTYADERGFHVGLSEAKYFVESI